MNARRALFVSSLLVSFALQGQAFRGLGTLSPVDPTPYSYAYGISASGTTVVGESESQAFRWSASAPTQLEALGFLPGGTYSSAQGVSADGSVVVGTCLSPDGSRACRWMPNMPPASLGVLAGTAESEGLDCSADGSVVVGRSYQPASRSFRWTEATEMIELESLPVPFKPAEVFRVSGDGLMAVGRSGCCNANQSAVEAVRWPNGEGVAVGLGDLQITTAPWSAAAGISADGLVIVGGATSPNVIGTAAFRWAGGSMAELMPPLPTGDKSCAMDASADGSIIVGAFSGGYGAAVAAPLDAVPKARAFLWTQAMSMTDLQGLLIGRGLGPSLVGWNLKIATGISDDGNIITGYGTHNGRTEAWVAALEGTPFPSDEPPPQPPPSEVSEVGVFFAGVREHHGFLWHPSHGPVPILPDPPPEILAAGAAQWIEGALAPRASEQLWGVLSDGGGGASDFRVVRYDGREWSLGFSSSAPAGTSQAFDISYENHAGDALAVYEMGAGTPRFRTYRRGLWSGEQPLPRESSPVGNVREGVVRWIELVPRAGSDEIALVYADHVGNIQTWTWDGTRWADQSATLLATDVKVDGTVRPFDAAYETLSGALVVAWVSRGKPGFTWARRPGSGSTWSKPTREPAFGARVDFVDLAAEPASNLIAGISIGAGSPVLSVWSGGRWDTSLGRHGQSRSLAAIPGAVAWAGTSRTALAVYGGAGEGMLDWSRWTSESGWSTQRSVTVPRKGVTRSVRMAGSAEGGPFLLLSDSNASLFAFHYEAGGWQTISEARSLASAESVPFGLSLSKEVVIFAGDADRCGKQRTREGGMTELLSFALVPAGRANRIDQLSFAVGNAAAMSVSEWSDLAVVVDANANGIVEADETAAVGGRGYATPFGRLVFFEPFEVSSPAHYVLRARLPALPKERGATVTLATDGIVSPRGFAAGGAGAELPRPCR